MLNVGFSTEPEQTPGRDGRLLNMQLIGAYPDRLIPPQPHNRSGIETRAKSYYIKPVLGLLTA